MTSRNLTSASAARPADFLAFKHSAHVMSTLQRCLFTYVRESGGLRCPEPPLALRAPLRELARALDPTRMSSLWSWSQELVHAAVGVGRSGADNLTDSVGDELDELDELVARCERTAGCKPCPGTGALLRWRAKSGHTCSTPCWLRCNSLLCHSDCGATLIAMPL